MSVSRVAPVVSLLVYLSLVTWLTWPLALHAGSHLPVTWGACRFDLPMTVSVLAHQSRALAGDWSSFTEPMAYHPTPHALFCGEAGVGALPYFMPLFLLSGNPALASNLTFLGAIALTAWALHRVVVRWTGEELAGLMAGCTFLGTRWVLWTWVPSVPNYAVLFYFPFLLSRVAEPRVGVRNILMVGALVGLQGLSTIYLAIPLGLGLGVLALARIVRPATRRAGLELLAALALAGCVLFVANVGHLLVAASAPGGSLESPWAFGRGFGMRLPEGLLGADAPLGIPLVLLLLIGVGGLLAAGARWEPRQYLTAWRQGTFWVTVGVLASLPPRVSFFGLPVVIGPLSVQTWIPALRRTDRMSVVGLFGIAILAGAAFAQCARHPRALPVGGAAAPFALAVALLGAGFAQFQSGYGVPRSLAFGPLPQSYPIEPAISPTSAVVEALAAIPSGPLLELPATGGPAGRPDPTANAAAMYRAIFRRRPLLNGYTGFYPVGFADRMSHAARLPDPEALAWLRRETGLTTILVRTTEFGRDARIACAALTAAGAQPGRCDGFGDEERARWNELADRGGGEDLRLLLRENGDLLFAVRDGRI